MVAFQRSVFSIAQPAIGLDHFERIGRRHQDIDKEAVGIKRDRRQHLVELLGRELRDRLSLRCRRRSLRRRRRSLRGRPGHREKRDGAGGNNRLEQYASHGPDPSREPQKSAGSDPGLYREEPPVVVCLQFGRIVSCVT